MERAEAGRRKDLGSSGISRILVLNSVLGTDEK